MQLIRQLVTQAVSVAACVRAEPLKYFGGGLGVLGRSRGVFGQWQFRCHYCSEAHNPKGGCSELDNIPPIGDSFATCSRARPSCPRPPTRVKPEVSCFGRAAIPDWLLGARTGREARLLAPRAVSKCPLNTQLSVHQEWRTDTLTGSDRVVVGSKPLAGRKHPPVGGRRRRCPRARLNSGGRR